MDEITVLEYRETMHRFCNEKNLPTPVGDHLDFYIDFFGNFFVKSLYFDSVEELEKGLENFWDSKPLAKTP